MKLFDLGTAVIFAGLVAIVAQGQNINATAVSECERVDMGGYFNFADANCPAQYMDDNDDVWIVDGDRLVRQ